MFVSSESKQEVKLLTFAGNEHLRVTPDIVPGSHSVPVAPNVSCDDTPNTERNHLPAAVLAARLEDRSSGSEQLHQVVPLWDPQRVLHSLQPM